MNSILLIKLLAIGVTIYLMTKNNERLSNGLGGLLVAVMVLTFEWFDFISGYPYLLYFLTLVAILIFVITKRIDVSQRGLTLALFIGLIIKTLPHMIFLPYIWINYFVAIGAIVLFAYFLIDRKRNNILVLTTIPVADCILTLTSS